MHKNVLFLGQKSLGERCFNLLFQAQNDKFQIKGVISNQTCQVWWNSNHIYQCCEINNIPFISNNYRNTKKILDLIEKFQVNIIISVQHPWILPDNVLSAVNFFAFNLHNAKIPDYKGNNAVNHVILNGERTYTSTIHWMSKGVDEGEIAFEESFKIDTNETARTLYEKALVSGTNVFKVFLEKIVNNMNIPKTPIQGSGTYYTRDSINSFREIININDSVEVDKKTRAFFSLLLNRHILELGIKNFIFYLKNLENMLMNISHINKLF